jgi:hypothetical protein
MPTEFTGKPKIAMKRRKTVEYDEVSSVDLNNTIATVQSFSSQLSLNTGMFTPCDYCKDNVK